MGKKLEQYLLSAVGKTKDFLSCENPYREVGFDGDKKRLGWVVALPFSKIKVSLNKIAEVLQGKKEFIFVGIGGSANGIKALLSLFRVTNIYVLDSLDTAAMKRVLRQIKDKKNILVIPISKSGTTQETQLIALTLKELFGDNWQDHFLWLSDPEAFEKLDSLGWQGTQKIAIQCDNASDVGGRFSCPNTLIFLLPLFLLLKKDLKKLEKIYDSYLLSLGKVRTMAYNDAEKYKNKTGAYFNAIITDKSAKSMVAWLVQLFQESLGSKKEGFFVKTISSKKADKMFSPVFLKSSVKSPVVKLMTNMYFFEVFVAYYAAMKEINFVDQPCVEKYKAVMRGGCNDRKTQIASGSLNSLINNVKQKLQRQQEFIEIVLYFYPRESVIRNIESQFKKSFPDKKVSLFMGSDWNHHSYQAAFADKSTFYVLVTAETYEVKCVPFSSVTLAKNIETLRLISRATFVTLKDKALLFSLVV